MSTIEQQDLLTQFQNAANEAKRLGDQQGRIAAKWWFNDERADRDQHLRALKGFEDGDPTWLDTLPSNPLSGEWADGLSPADLMNELGLIFDPQDFATNDAAEWLCGIFEEAFHQAVNDEVVMGLRSRVATKWDFKIIAELVHEDADDLLMKIETIFNEQGIDIQHSSVEEIDA